MIYMQHNAAYRVHTSRAPFLDPKINTLLKVYYFIYIARVKGKESFLSRFSRLKTSTYTFTRANTVIGI